jgi:hypothetical protein
MNSEDGAMFEAPCASHPSNPAAAICERCGDFTCALCATEAEGKQFCPRCFDLLYARGAFATSQQQFTLPGVTLGLGLAGFISSLVCFCILIAVPLGIGGVGTGFRALQEYRERPELPQRGMTITGLVFSTLALLISAGQVVFWAIFFANRR